MTPILNQTAMDHGQTAIQDPRLKSRQYCPKRACGETLQDDSLSSGIKRGCSRAANLIRESIGAKGVIFLDANNERFGSLVKQTHRKVSGPTSKDLSSSGDESTDSASSSKRHMRALTLHTSPISTPVKDLLSNPAKDIICQFAVLETRYQRYCRGSDLADGRYFQIATPLLTLVTDQSPVNDSRIITREILQSFRRISLKGAWNDDCHLKAIARRWSRLCHEVEEIAAS
ncbi:hypothetical protein N7522_000351 [Penicillium canescens]|uniref:Uncharacterized protein n=1 Tax=Penicillium canescens TaxID=5083 RepID=A0AAD6I9Z2_PENCN|nr:hypothetical protein N7522_000351 [Penicillium canescens]KAJ6038677.1 hypothetical protein N7460_007394 [Penicillium canescens]